MSEPLVSIIVPVFRDAGQLEALLESFELEPRAELIVVDGEPGDDAAFAALRERFPRARWYRSAPGRWRQMNEGAARADGRWLLFLHADARLDPGWLAVVAHAERGGHVGGSYRLQLDSPTRAARLIEWGVAQRVRWAGFPYGDQALFVRRDVFSMLGGFRPMDLMEDVDFVRRLKRVGPLLHADVPVRVSARRWQHDGWIRRSSENTALVLLFFAGVPPDRLARLYYRNGASWKAWWR